MYEDRLYIDTKPTSDPIYFALKCFVSHSSLFKQSESFYAVFVFRKNRFAKFTNDQCKKIRKLCLLSTETYRKIFRVSIIRLKQFSFSKYITKMYFRSHNHIEKNTILFNYYCIKNIFLFYEKIRRLFRGFVTMMNSMIAKQFSQN